MRTNNHGSSSVASEKYHVKREIIIAVLGVKSRWVRICVICSLVKKNTQKQWVFIPSRRISCAVLVHTVHLNNQGRHSEQHLLEFNVGAKAARRTIPEEAFLEIRWHECYRWCRKFVSALINIRIDHLWMQTNPAFLHLSDFLCCRQNNRVCRMLDLGREDFE